MDKRSKINNTKKISSVSIFFPCHNEEDNVENLARKALKVGSKIAEDYEIIVVDDGSTDQTKKIAEKIAAEDKHLKVISHTVNQGYGGALQSGFKNASKEFIFYTDGDGQFDLNEIENLLPLLEKYDVVSGYRKNRKDPVLRKLNAYFWNKLVCFLFDLDLKDIDCAFKLYKKNVFSEIILESKGALIDTEILAKISNKGFKIGQVGVSHHPRLYGKSSGANLKVIFRAFKELFKFYVHLK